MRITEFVLKQVLEEISERISKVEIFSLAEPTHLLLPNENVKLSKKILELGGRIEDWDSGLNEFYLDFPGKKFRAGIIENLEGVTYCLVSFGYNQRIITFSETEVDEVEYDDLPPLVRGILKTLAYDEVLLSIKS